mgnify:CR=1 FL=1
MGVQGPGAAGGGLGWGGEGVGKGAGGGDAEVGEVLRVAGPFGLELVDDQAVVAPQPGPGAGGAIEGSRSFELLHHQAAVLLQEGDVARRFIHRPLEGQQIVDRQ